MIKKKMPVIDKIINKKIPFIKIEGLSAGIDKTKIKSIYDLRTKLDADLFTTISYLLKKIQTCDLDPGVYFMLHNAKNMKELGYAIQKILYETTSRKYDVNARNILFTLQFLLDVEPKHILKM